MLKHLKALFAGLFTAAHWKRWWETLLEMVRGPRAFFSGIGKPEVDDRAYQLGLTSGFAATILAAMMLAGFVAIASGFQGILTGPVTFLFLVLFWLVGVFILYTIVAWIYSLSVKWVIGPYEPAKIRPVLFAVGVSSLTFLVPGIGGLIGMAFVIVFTVIAYEVIFKATRGQAIGATLLGMFLTALPAFMLSFALAGLMMMSQGAGFYGMTGLMNLMRNSGKDVVHQSAPEQEGRRESQADQEADASEAVKSFVELGQRMEELVARMTATPDFIITPESDAEDAGTAEMREEPATAAPDQVAATPTIVVTRVPARIAKPRPTPTEEVFPEQPRTLQIYRVPAKKK